MIISITLCVVYLAALFTASDSPPDSGTNESEFAKTVEQLIIAEKIPSSSLLFPFD